MASELLLNVRLTPAEKMVIIKLNNVDLKEKVEKLRTETAGQANLTNDSFDLVYCGCLLENDSTMESYGLKNGSMINVLKKKEIKQKPSTSNDAEINVEMITSLFSSIFGNASLITIAMRRLTKKPEVIENIIASSPGLKDDPVAIAILQDPDLIAHITNPDTVKKIAKSHPALLEAVQHLAVAVHNEAHNFLVRGYDNIEHLSDDEEMAGDSSQSSDSTQPSNSANETRNQPNSIVSAARILAALNRAQQSTSSSSSNTSSTPPPVSSAPRTNSDNTVRSITLAMVNRAMRQAFESSSLAHSFANSAQTSPSFTAPPTSTSFTAPPSVNLPNNMQRQIAIMHEMGLQNDAVNIQALQITNGNVEAAIELLISGFGDDN